MKKKVLLAATSIILAACTNYPKVESSMPYKVVNGTIVLDEPQRAPGQESMMGVACEPIETVRIGLVGIGNRGRSELRTLSQIDGAQITAICDLYQDHLDDGREILEKNGHPAPREYVGEDSYKQLCEADDIDIVYVSTGWQMHAPIALYALNHGKHVAIEVTSATSIKECWDLVDASERNRRHCIILENCCYDKFELTTLNLSQQGILGEVYHGEGGYIHNIGRWNKYTDNWRLDFNRQHAGDNYPTHGLGPVCQCMNINRGDRMTKLVAMSTKPMRSAEMGKKFMDADEFAEGDQVCTLINTENGHEILIQHNVYGNRPYSRLFMVSGTKGMASKYPFKWFSLSKEELPGVPEMEQYKDHGVPIDEIRENTKEAYDYITSAYEHPIWTENEKRALEVGGHGGMDYILNTRIIYCLQNGLPVDLNVYDLAQWSCPVELTAISINSGNMPVAVPDFTRGDWDKFQGMTFAHTK